MIFGIASSIKNIVSSSIVRTESEDVNRLPGLSDGAGGILDQRTNRIDYKGSEDAVAKTDNYTTTVMDQAQPAMIKDADYVVDVILPTILIALLFVGNAVIVYIIFQYRKRNVDDNFRKTPTVTNTEEIALSATTNGDPQV